MPHGVDADAAMETIHVRMPAKPEYVSVARLTAAAVAARHRFTYDEIEDLKIAVSEACSAAIAARTPGPLVLRFVPREGALEVCVQSGRRFRVAQPTGREAAEDERALGLFLMQCLVDDVRYIDEGNGATSLCLLKRRQEDREPGAPSSP